MKAAKIILSVSAISSALCCLILMWNEDSVTCGYTTCKLIESIFFITALALTREVSIFDFEKKF